MIYGSCLCNTVRWSYDGAFDRLTHCHCGMCRKAHGAAFASYAVGPANGFSLNAGQSAKVSRESSPGFFRSFCGDCGSVLPNSDLGEIVACPAGGFDGDLGIEPSAHIFAKWKAPWHKITDGLTQHDNYPGQLEPAVQRSEPTSSSDEHLRGSCLCGSITFEMQGGFTHVHNCHCSRCRKALAAAHSTNGFTAIDKLQFTRGEHRLKTYKLTSAKYYSHAFCLDCGCSLPRRDAQRGIAVVPLAALDDDPGRSAERHIYVSSKSSWYPITDELAQFPQAAE